MGPLFWIILGIIILSSVVGMIAKVLSNFQEQQQQPIDRRRPVPVRQEEEEGRAGGQKEMERFLAELDRLRGKKENSRKAPAVPAVPVVVPVKKPPRPRLAVEPVAPPPPPPPPRSPGMAEAVPPDQFGPRSTPPPPPPPPPPATAPFTVTAATAPSGETGAPATQVTRFAPRARPTPKTPLAKNLTTLLSTGQGLALAIVLQEVLGPPKCRRPRRLPGR